MKISVTQEHIDSGEALSCSLCPIALAFSDLNIVAKVFKNNVHAEIGNFIYIRGLPEIAKSFIKKFDNLTTDKLEPFDFEIDL